MENNQNDTVKMVNAIDSGNNVKAYSYLEKIMRQKLADKIDRAVESSK